MLTKGSCGFGLPLFGQRAKEEVNMRELTNAELDAVSGGYRHKKPSIDIDISRNQINSVIAGSINFSPIQQTNYYFKNSFNGPSTV
jgi:hypothetical protein